MERKNGKDDCCLYQIHSIENGILEVSISSSPLKKELQMSKTQIISAINEELGVILL
ncbi:MAG: DUF721 domain-containing protein [Saprospiraceae bacterium]|nr:DUF721 domain-containing protein [Saprospiraceae bacterium]